MAVRSAARLSLWLLLLSCTRAIVHHRLPLGAHRGSLPSLYRASQPPRCAADFDATPGKETVAARCVAERLQKIRAAGRLPRRPYGLPQLLRYLWPREGAWVAKARVAGALLMLIAAKIFVVRVPFFFKRAVDALAGTAPQPAVAAAWMVAYGLARATYTLLQEGRYLLFAPVAQRALRRFVGDGFAHLQALDFGWLAGQSTGELSRVFARGVRGMNAILRLLVFNVAPTAFEVLLVLAILGRGWGSRYVAAALLSIVLFVSWSLFVVEKRVQLLLALNDADNRIFTRFFNVLLNNEAMRVFTNEGIEMRKYDNLLGAVEKLSVEDVKTVALLNAGQALLYWGVGLGSVMALSASSVASGAMSIGELVAVHGLLIQLNAPLASLGYSYQEIRQAIADLKQLMAVLRLRPTVVSAADAPPLRPAGPTRVEFRNVRFGYNASHTEANLNGVSFSLPPGKKTAIVGPSGSGKSTILKLLLRLYDPAEGEVLIDGQDVKKVDLASLRDRVAIVPQDTILFDDSVLYNVRYGDLDAPEAAARAAARKVGLDQVAARMADGYATKVGERGMTLSGGERQRVAIARALLKDPPLMLADEPTSALDAMTERDVQRVLDRAWRGRTSVVVAHRLASVVDADTILVMKDGSLVERGAHADLVSVPGGVYAAMWAQQASSTNATQWLPQRPPDAWAGMPDYRALLPDGAIQGELLGASSNDAAPRRSSSTAARPGQTGDAPLDPGRLADGSIQGALLGAEPEVVGETIEDEMETEALRAAQGWLW